MTGSIKMDKQYTYEIRVEGILTDQWSDWFENLDIKNQSNGETTLKGSISDQASLIGMLYKLHSLNLTLISVTRCLPETEK
jgi:hypothetical protein